MGWIASIITVTLICVLPASTKGCLNFKLKIHDCVLIPLMNTRVARVEDGLGRIWEFIGIVTSAVCCVLQSRVSVLGNKYLQYMCRQYIHYDYWSEYSWWK